MPTEKQSEAARANGAKSKGPVTPEGKQASAANSTKHGLFSSATVLRGEAVERFEALHASLFAEHQPTTQTEVAMVEIMAAALWRQLRVWGFQTLTINNRTAQSDQPARFVAMETYILEPDIPTLLRYETTFSRQFSRALKELNALKARRTGYAPNLPAEPLNVETWDPIPSPPAINQILQNEPGNS